MGYKGTDKCLQKAFDDERLFVLMARDNTAPELVVEWIKQNLRTQPKAKLQEALDCAIVMYLTQDEMVERKKYNSTHYVEGGAKGYCLNCGADKESHTSDKSCITFKTTEQITNPDY